MRNVDGSGLGIMLGALGLLVVLAACGKRASADGGASGAPDGATSTVLAVPSDAGGAGMVPRGSIGGRLAYELAHRPSGTPRAEDVFAAIEAAGVPLAKKAQHLGAPVKADFCMGAQDEADGLSLSACEYASPAAAADGRNVSATAFQAIPDRVVLVDKATTLTILEYPKSDKSAAAAKSATDAFMKL